MDELTVKHTFIDIPKDEANNSAQDISQRSCTEPAAVLRTPQTDEEIVTAKVICVADCSNTDVTSIEAEENTTLDSAKEAEKKQDKPSEEATKKNITEVRRSEFGDNWTALGAGAHLHGRKITVKYTFIQLELEEKEEGNGPLTRARTDPARYAGVFDYTDEEIPAEEIPPANETTWEVDAKKLKTRVRVHVSREFKLSIGGREVGFKMLLKPKKTCGEKGVNFFDCNGCGSIELKCQDPFDANRETAKASYKISIRSGHPDNTKLQEGIKVEHDFATNAISSDGKVWNFQESVDDTLRFSTSF